MAKSATNPDLNSAGGALRVDLGALVANWRLLAAAAAPAVCGAVVKADAYGTGVARAAPALAAAGCARFFVATLDEAIELRGLLGVGPTIFMFNGILPGTAEDTHSHAIIPVLNDLGQIEEWHGLASQSDRPLPAALHTDTGMSRLGLPPSEVAALSNEPQRMDGIDLLFVISHLACAEDPDNPMNEAQLLEFLRQKAALLPGPASLANSSGIFLGAGYHFEMVRPGVALYGGNPTPKFPNPVSEVVQIKGKIVQIRDVDLPQTVGYGAAFPVAGPTRIATVAIGYADGILRSLGEKQGGAAFGTAFGSVGGVSAPIVGRISMDLITLDVTAVPPATAHPGAWVNLVGGGGMSLDEAAAAAGTIAYEILTSLGARYRRQYVPTDA